MQKYTINKINKKLFYKKQLFDFKTNKLIFSKSVVFPMYKTNINGKTFIVLYNDDMQVIDDFYDYINNHYFSSFNTQLRNAVALRYLFIFLELNSYSIYDFSEKIINELKTFLLGLTIQNGTDRLIRMPETINSYFSVYRSFYQFKKINAPSLFSKYTSRNLYSDDLIVKTNAPYCCNVKTNKNNLDTPKYISVDEFERIKKYLISRNDKQSYVMIKLMFSYGLRLGEVLGLTSEDFTEIEENGTLTPVVYLRNRISDQKYQYCKNIYHPTRVDEYKTKFYSQTWVKITLTYEFYETIINMIAEQFEFYHNKNNTRFSESRADSIFGNKNNHYVFLNRYGRALSDQTWNNHLKKIFIELNIPIDVNVKDANLSHRFRHGFAMHHARFCSKPATAFELMTLMRHKSVQSTEKYYRPTIKDQIDIKTKFVNELNNTSKPGDENDNSENKQKNS